MTILSELFAPLTSAQFLRRHWPERHLVTHGPLERLPSFFRSELLLEPRALSDAYRGSLSVTRHGRGQYRVSGPDARAYFEDLGLSVKFDAIEDVVPGARDWLRSLETELGVPRGGTTLIAFVNAAGSGLAAHCDPSEQIAIHLRGAKEFRVKPAPVRFPTVGYSARRGAPAEWLGQFPEGLPPWTVLPADAEKVPLAPGSVLFTPRGLFHQTLANDELAVTVVVKIHNPTPAELVSAALGNVLLQSPQWRRPLDGAWAEQASSRKGSRRVLSGLLKELGRRLPKLDPEALLDGALKGRFEARDCRAHTRFQRDALAKLSISSRKGGLQVEVALADQRSTMQLPGAAKGPMLWLSRRRRAFRFDQLTRAFPAWEAPSLAALLVFLVRSGAFVWLPFEGFE